PQAHLQSRRDRRRRLVGRACNCAARRLDRRGCDRRNGCRRREGHPCALRRCWRTGSCASSVGRRVSTLGEMLVKRLLLLAYFFPPDGGAGAQRPLKFAKYLPLAGWHVTVLTHGTDEARTRKNPFDESLHDEVGEALEV